jgi:NAD(P)-dependent dehydrogenase (short-subunit alcohol dehydrogenase family)
VSSEVVLITGCSSGIGRVAAELFAARGCTVYATARRPDTLRPLAALGCRTLFLDVTDDASMTAVVAGIEAEHGAVDVLVNNAGYGQQGALEETPMSRFRAQFETNVFGAVRLCQLVLPAMRAKRSGRIVMISSMGGRITFPGGSAYHGSKYALEAISDVLRFELANFGVSVVVVEPGLVATEYGSAALSGLEGDEHAGAYASFTAGVRAALEQSFSGGVDGTSSAHEVAEAIVRAATEQEPRTRYVVGAMAEQLIGLRQQMDDQQWDEMMTTMYIQPQPAD